MTTVYTVCTQIQLAHKDLAFGRTVKEHLMNQFILVFLTIEFLFSPFWKLASVM